MTGYNKNIDYDFYKKIDKIIAVSQYGKESIISINKDYEKKTEVILDIVNPRLIESMADEEVVFEDKSYINICTVARLITHYKGYDMAIKAAKLLKDSEYKFRWYAVGEGEDRPIIERMIEELGLKKEFILIGKKSNPYPYMKNCDIYVQPSRNEGFGLTIVEAKILNKPIVCTDFDNAKVLINNEEDGIIVGKNELQIYLGIKKYLESKEFKEDIIKHLERKDQYNSIQEINKFYELVR
ncbi:N-acetylgalactosamine-N,N'-diacetylbacillosaminyl-diphospho-undecaprenol 4-alpha-N-acetylgalactosaminyltransferase [bioreactor metagenome]|uniref:N-acetylgalactosamine-N, N'-diacetylbacillosaminyl-diphospho-undecaprenol 4-alpha-N-acetylgalactosaminyltransferase n=1 Tax=bioreactor metagenome TaxID=1076179 RepID=A0A645GI70_9ZZZZ